MFEVDKIEYIVSMLISLKQAIVLSYFNSHLTVIVTVSPMEHALDQHIAYFVLLHLQIISSLYMSYIIENSIMYVYSIIILLYCGVGGQLKIGA